MRRSRLGTAECVVRAEADPEESPPLAEDGRDVSGLRRLPEEDEAEIHSSYCILWKGEEHRENHKSRRPEGGKIESGDEFVLLEVLSQASYKRAHLPGAIRFQDMNPIPDLVPDKNTEVVAYCSNFN